MNHQTDAASVTPIGSGAAAARQADLLERCGSTQLAAEFRAQVAQAEDGINRAGYPGAGGAGSFEFITAGARGSS